MSQGKFYTSERNVQILISILKANGIKRIIASPGATNFTFVGSLQDDSYFEIYSCVDERSAAYIACGMAAESKEPVVLSCTGSTASRNYYPGLTEAYYRKLPVLAVTSHQGSDRIGHLLPQNIDRHSRPADLVRLSVELPIVKDDRDENYVVTETNRAILELTRNGGGPVHINLITTYSTDFSEKELPNVKVIKRYFLWHSLPDIPSGRIGIYVGTHTKFTESQNVAINNFCATYDAVVICDHTSGYYGPYRLLPTLLLMQKNLANPLPAFDLMIHIGEVSAAAFLNSFHPKEVWRVNEDGEIRDTFKRLTSVFQMSEESFFLSYSKEGCSKHEFIDYSRRLCGKIYEKIPELPFSNIWVAQTLSPAIPKGSIFHLGVSNTRRSWNMFSLPESVSSSCNVGCCGIDGCLSTLIGASLVDPEKLCYIVLGDLTFFYDLNVLGNRHVGKNVRILLINNGKGTEFRLKIHFCNSFGEDANKYMAAAGHFGNQSSSLVRHIATDLGFQYITASTKDEFLANMPVFTNPSLAERPILFEVFTKSEDESEALEIITNLDSNLSGMLKSNVVKMIKDVAGEKGINTVKNIVGKIKG